MGSVTLKRQLPGVVTLNGGPIVAVPTTFQATSIAGCKLWLRASLGVTLNGSAVSAWADQSGNGNHFAQATANNQPVNATGAIGGQPAITFNAASFPQCLAGPSFVGVGGGGAGMDCFAVIRQNAAAAGDGLCVFGADGGGDYCAYLDGHVYLGIAANGRADLGLMNPAANVAQVIESRITAGVFPAGAHLVFSQNGTAPLYDAAGYAVAWEPAGSLIGAFASSGITPLVGMSGVIAEWIIYDHDLSAPDRATVLAGLRALYGTP